MPDNLQPIAEDARKRHRKRHANPGVAIEVEMVTEHGYRLASPHSDTEAWQAMVCDALGTRSEATALTFLYQLTKLCEQNWHPNDENGGGEWVPDECELNMILNMVTSIKPKNEMQAALAAQMVAVHLLTMKVAEKCLSRSQSIDGQLAGVRASICSSHEPLGAPRLLAWSTTALLPIISNRLSVRSPIFDIAPSFCLPPVEY